MTFASSGASSSPFSIERNFPQQVYWTCGGFWIFVGIEARPSSWRLRAGQTRRRHCFICFKRSCPEYYFIGAFGVVRAQLAYFACRSGSDTFLYLVRPPCSAEVASIASFEVEWARLAPDFIGTIVVGDLNVHHTHWLRHSTHVSVEGTRLYRFCIDNGFRQCVSAPTRGDNTLDLV